MSKKAVKPVLPKYNEKERTRRLGLRARALYIGRIGTHINRVEKLTSILARNGKRKRIEDAVLDLKIRIKEYFLPLSSSDFLENLLTRLEPILDVKEVKQFKRKHTNRKYKKPKSYMVSPASITRRIRLGLGFFVKAIRLTQRKLQFTVATAMMVEVLALCKGLKCQSMRLKRDHIFNTIRFFNRFGTPVEVGSKLANRFEKKTNVKQGKFKRRWSNRNRFNNNKQFIRRGNFRRYQRGQFGQNRFNNNRRFGRGQFGRNQQRQFIRNRFKHNNVGRRGNYNNNKRNNNFYNKSNWYNKKNGFNKNNNFNKDVGARYNNQNWSNTNNSYGGRRGFNRNNVPANNNNRQRSSKGNVPNNGSFGPVNISKRNYKKNKRFSEDRRHDKVRRGRVDSKQPPQNGKPVSSKESSSNINKKGSKGVL